MRKAFTTLLMAAALTAVAQPQTTDSYDVWNISETEFASIAPIELAWFGYYAGSNTLGMEKFAEHFDSPSQPVKINSVKALFAKGDAADAGKEIKAIVCKPDADGMPGEEIATATITASEILCNTTTKPETVFTFNEPVSIEGEFFIVMDGIAEASDDICLYCKRRAEGQLCTAFQLVEDEDPITYQRLGTYTWFKNVEDPTSMAIGVNMTNDDTNGINNIATDSANSPTQRYTLNGQRTTSPPRGIQIIRNSNGKTMKVLTK